MCPSCFSGTRSHLSFSSNPLRPPIPHLGLFKCLIGDLLTSEGQKLHPQNILMPQFSEHVSHEETRSSFLPVQNNSYFTFFLPPITFPQVSDHPASLSHKYPKPLAFEEADLRLVLLSSHLTALRKKPFFDTNLGASAFDLVPIGQINLIR